MTHSLQDEITRTLEGVCFLVMPRFHAGLSGGMIIFGDSAVAALDPRNKSVNDNGGS
jgi:hypothetical protein